MKARGVLIRVVVPAVLLLSGQGAHAAPDDLVLSTQQMFAGPVRMGTSRSMWVEIENRGPDAGGMLVAQAPGYKMTYPVSLPRGSKKRMPVYYDDRHLYSGLELTLITNRARLRLPVEPPNTNTTDKPLAVLIGSNMGGLAFLETQQGNKKIFSAAYGRPGSLPDRMQGYSPAALVVLGDGAERMSDDEVLALKEWILTGGTLLITGGASAPVLRDQRWADLLPITGPFETKAKSSFEAVMKGVGSAPVSVTLGRPKEDASVYQILNDPLVVKRPAGFGLVVYFGMSLFEPPLNKLDTRHDFFVKHLPAEERARQMLMNARAYDYDYPVHPHGGMYGRAEPTASDPFNASLPSAGTIALILLGYLILVVPVNLAVLRTLKKSEWAWATAPLISLVFAGVFFRFAGSLYAASMSTATSGVLVMDSSTRHGMFLGDTEMFFPRGGRYDLQLRDVQFVGVAPRYDFYSSMGRGDATSKLDPKDVGEIVIDRLNTGNLGFHEFSFGQRVDGPSWFEGTVSLEKKGKQSVFQGRVVNRSPYRLVDGKVVVDGVWGKVGDLEPGQTKALQDVPVEAGAFLGDHALTLYQPLFNKRGSVLFGELEGFRPGPQLGKEVKRPIKLVAFVGGGQASDGAGGGGSK
jgi:hypothetical protein